VFDERYKSECGKICKPRLVECESVSISNVDAEIMHRDRGMDDLWSNLDRSGLELLEPTQCWCAPLFLLVDHILRVLELEAVICTCDVRSPNSGQRQWTCVSSSKRSGQRPWYSMLMWMHAITSRDSQCGLARFNLVMACNVYLSTCHGDTNIGTFLWTVSPTVLIITADVLEHRQGLYVRIIISMNISIKLCH